MGFGKKGDLSITFEPLVRIAVWVLPFFFIMLFYINAYADDGYAVRQTYAVDTGLILEAMQSANGNLVYNYETPYTFYLKSNTAYLDVNQEQNLKYEFARDSSHIFKDSIPTSGKVTITANGNEISIIKEDTAKIEEKIKTKLTCKKREEPLTSYALALNPAHGGIETGMTSESTDEGRFTFNIANAFSMLYSKEISTILTRDAENSFASNEDRIAKAKDVDLMISIHVGSAVNKGKISIFIPDDSRMQESQMLGCEIANSFFDSYEISYPQSMVPAGYGDMLKAGKVASVQIEVGSIEDKQSAQKIAELIKKGVINYANPK